MKNTIKGLLIILLFFFGLGKSSAQCYELIWGDEFNYTGQPDPTKWTHEVGNSGWGNNELQFYTDQRLENARVVDSVLIIEARKENYGGSQYTSARLISYNKASFKYGKIEARLKLPKGQGLWPAFWTLGNNIFKGTGWPSCGEIDIMELVGGGEGRDDRTYGTVHWSDNNGNYARYGGNKQLASGVYNDDFHVFSIEWTETYIKWYMDGNQFHVVNTTPSHMTEFHKKMFLLLNVAVGGDWPGNPNSGTKFPQQMVVDYVRVYQKNVNPSIEGKSSVVKAEKNLKYSVYGKAENTYVWTVPAGVEIVKGQGSSEITVNWGCDDDTVKCIMTSACSNYSLNVPVKVKALKLDGDTKVEAYKQNLLYQVAPTKLGAYTWSFPEGVAWDLQDTNLISCTWGDQSGYISVNVANTCGEDSAKLLVSAIKQSPYPDENIPHPIPGKIQIVHYDQGGEGVAYHDFDTGNNGPGIRQNEHVDTEKGDGFGNIGWTEPGEWLEYTTKVEEDDVYDLEFRVASINSQGRFQLLFDGVEVTQEVQVPNTGNWTAYRSVHVKNVGLKASDRLMRLEIINGSFNMASVTFTKSTSALAHVKDNELSIYPSFPTSDIYLKNINNKVNYTIVNVSGKMVLKGFTMPDKPISVVNLNSGIYFLKVYTSSGIKTRKFIKSL